METTDERTHGTEEAAAGAREQGGVVTHRRDRTSHAHNARRRLKQEAALLALTTGGPTDVLARLSNGDPLGLALRLVRRAAARALLVSPERLFERGAAHCARRASEYRGRPRPELWIERRAEEVVRSFEREGDAVFTVGGGPSPGVRAATAGTVARAGAAGGTNARVSEVASTARHATALERAAARFNACPRADRQALWRLAFAGQSLDQQASDARCSLSEVARRARRALDALLSVAVEVRPHVAPRREHGSTSRAGDQR